MNNNASTSLEQILTGYVAKEQLPYVVQTVRAYYIELLGAEGGYTVAKHLRQKIVKS